MTDLTICLSVSGWVAWLTSMREKLSGSVLTEFHEMVLLLDRSHCSLAVGEVILRARFRDGG